jgi:hypothetical protein
MVRGHGRAGPGGRSTLVIVERPDCERGRGAPGDAQPTVRRLQYGRVHAVAGQQIEHDKGRPPRNG